MLSRILLTLLPSTPFVIDPFNVSKYLWKGECVQFVFILIGKSNEYRCGRTALFLERTFDEIRPFIDLAAEVI